GARGTRPDDRRARPDRDESDDGEHRLPPRQAGETRSPPRQPGREGRRRRRARRRFDRGGGAHVRTFRGTLTARSRRVAIVAARFNELVVGKLVEGALACLSAQGVSDDDVDVAWTPG